MAEYIKRDAAIREIEQINPVDYGAMWDYEAHHWAGECLRDCKEAIDSIPTADVAPVVHGRWSDAGFGELPKHAPYGWACSACGGISFNNEYIYCPNCGARMDGGQCE